MARRRRGASSAARCGCRATSRASSAPGSATAAVRPRSRARIRSRTSSGCSASAPTSRAATWKYLEPKDWLNYQLTGRCAATFDSIVLHWVTDNRDPARVDYDPELLRIAGLDRAQLPDLVPATSIVGSLTEQAASALGVRAGIAVVGGTPDLQSAAIGSGAVRDFEGHLYVGTSSWLTCHVPFKKTDLFHGIASLPSPLPGKYYVADEQEVAGGCLEWLREHALETGDDFRTLDAVAGASAPGSNGVIFTPWLNGERTPVDDHTLRAGWHNLSLATTRSDLVRSVLEGVAYNSRWLLATVEKFVGRPFPWLHFIGGGAQSELWCRIMADVLEREIRQVEHPIRANARGAALLAGIALGADHGRRPCPQRPGRRDLHARAREPRDVRRSLCGIPACCTSRRAGEPNAMSTAAERGSPRCVRDDAFPMRGVGPGRTRRARSHGDHLAPSRRRGLELRAVHGRPSRRHGRHRVRRQPRLVSRTHAALGRAERLRTGR